MNLNDDPGEDPSDFEITPKRETKKKSPTTTPRTKNLVMTPAEATTRSKKLPKGYVLEVDTSLPPPPKALPAKRERKKVPHSDEEDDDDDEDAPVKTRKVTKAKGKAKGKVDDDPAEKKRALMEQLAQIQQKLAEVDEEVEVVKREPSTKRGPAKQKAPRKAKRGTSASVYDRFDSDDEPIKPKARGRGAPVKTVTTERSTRVRKPTKQFDEGSDSSEDVGRRKADDPKEWKKVLETLRRHPKSYPFHVPVDANALRCFDYYDIIKRPMDFSTIAKNIDHTYSTAEEFVDDVRQVFRNALLYNQPGSDICQFTEILSDIFEKAISKWRLQEPKLTDVNQLPPPPPVAMDTEMTGEPIIPKPPEFQPNSALKLDLKNTIVELEDSIKKAKEDIRRLKREKTLAAAPKAPRPPPKRQVDETVKPMTYEEKVALSQAINELPRKSLGNVVQIIKNNIPAFANTALDEIEVDIDVLGDEVLRTLEKYVKTAQKRKPRQVKNPAVPAAPVVPAGASKEVQSKMAITQTAKSIESVKKKLNELKGVKDENQDVNVDDLDEPKHDSSSSSSSSDSSDSSDSSETDENDEKKRAMEGPVQLPEVGPTVPTAPMTSPMEVESESKDSVLKVPETVPNSETRNEVKSEVEKPSDAEPQILEGAVKKDVELQNLDGWNQLAESAPSTTEDNDVSKQNQKDETWEQFQAKDLQNKQRLKELKEQEEAQKREKVEREMERKRLEDLKLKEERERELKQKQLEEEAVQAQRRELQEKRAAEKKAREEASANSLDMMGQSVMMSSFATDFSGGGSAVGLSDLLKLKDELKKD